MMGFWKVRSPKFAPNCGARVAGKSKSLKSGGGGAFFGRTPQKICARLQRESALDGQTVKTRGSRNNLFILVGFKNAFHVAGGRSLMGHPH